MKRRSFIQGFSALSFLATVSPSSVVKSETGKKRSFKVAFISDIHVKPTDVAETGMRKALRHVNNLKPDFIIKIIIKPVRFMRYFKINITPGLR